MVSVPFLWPTRTGDWDLLVPASEVTLVKRIVADADVVRYPGVVVESAAPSPWIEIEAQWTSKSVVQGSLRFDPGDILREFFSCEHPYNAFSVFTPDHQHKGWYANVTYPSWIELQHGRPQLIWHDLMLDVVADANGVSVNLDDDELEKSGLAESRPELHRAIVAARDEILEHIGRRTGPFVRSLFES